MDEEVDMDKQLKGKDSSVASSPVILIDSDDSNDGADDAEMGEDFQITMNSDLSDGNETDEDTETVNGDTETVNGDTETVNEDTQAVNGDTETVKEDRETVNEDTETVNGDRETVNEDTETVNEDTEMVNEVTETVNKDRETVDEDTETVNEDTATVNGDKETVNEDTETVNEDTETVNGDTETVNEDTETVNGDTETVNGDTETVNEDTGTVKDTSTNDDSLNLVMSQTSPLKFFSSESCNLSKDVNEVTETGKLKSSASHNKNITSPRSEELSRKDSSGKSTWSSQPSKSIPCEGTKAHKSDGSNTNKKIPDYVMLLDSDSDSERDQIGNKYNNKTSKQKKQDINKEKEIIATHSKTAPAQLQKSNDQVVTIDSDDEGLESGQKSKKSVPVQVEKANKECEQGASHDPKLKEALAVLQPEGKDEVEVIRLDSGAVLVGQNDAVSHPIVLSDDDDDDDDATTQESISYVVPASGVIVNKNHSATKILESNEPTIAVQKLQQLDPLRIINAERKKKLEAVRKAQELERMEKVEAERRTQLAVTVERKAKLERDKKKSAEKNKKMRLAAEHEADKQQNTAPLDTAKVVESVSGNATQGLRQEGNVLPNISNVQQGSIVIVSKADATGNLSAANPAMNPALLSSTQQLANILNKPTSVPVPYSYTFNKVDDKIILMPVQNMLTLVPRQQEQGQQMQLVLAKSAGNSTAGSESQASVVGQQQQSVLHRTVISPSQIATLTRPQATEVTQNIPQAATPSQPLNYKPKQKAKTVRQMRSEGYSLPQNLSSAELNPEVKGETVRQMRSEGYSLPQNLSTAALNPEVKGETVRQMRSEGYSLPQNLSTAALNPKVLLVRLPNSETQQKGANVQSPAKEKSHNIYVRKNPVNVGTSTEQRLSVSASNEEVVPIDSLYRYCKVQQRYIPLPKIGDGKSTLPNDKNDVSPVESSGKAGLITVNSTAESPGSALHPFFANTTLGLIKECFETDRKFTRKSAETTATTSPSSSSSTVTTTVTSPSTVTNNIKNMNNIYITLNCNDAQRRSVVTQEENKAEKRKSGSPKEDRSRAKKPRKAKEKANEVLSTLDKDHVEEPVSNLISDPVWIEPEVSQQSSVETEEDTTTQSPDEEVEVKIEDQPKKKQRIRDSIVIPDEVSAKEVAVEAKVPFEVRPIEIQPMDINNTSKADSSTPESSPINVEQEKSCEKSDNLPSQYPFLTKLVESLFLNETKGDHIECCQCGKASSNSKEYCEHFVCKQICGAAPYCYVCHKNFPDLESFLEHMKSERLICGCKMTFGSYLQLYQHCEKGCPHTPLGILCNELKMHQEFGYVYLKPLNMKEPQNLHVLITSKEDRYGALVHRVACKRTPTGEMIMVCNDEHPTIPHLVYHRGITFVKPAPTPPPENRKKTSVTSMQDSESETNATTTCASSNNPVSKQLTNNVPAVYKVAPMEEVKDNCANNSATMYQCEQCGEQFRYHLRLDHHEGTVHGRYGDECKCFICKRKKLQQSKLTTFID